MNGLLLGQICKWHLEEYNKWDMDLPASVFACNTQPNSSTSFSAMQSLMGYTAGTASEHKILQIKRSELRHHLTLVLGGLSKNFEKERVCMLESLRDEAVRVKDIKADKMKACYDHHVKTQRFELGDLVLLFNLALLKQWSHKLEEC